MYRVPHYVTFMCVCVCVVYTDVSMCACNGGCSRFYTEYCNIMI